MAHQIKDYSAFLDETIDAIEDLEKDKKLLEQLELEEKRLEKAIESEEKAVSDSINLTVKKRVDEINSSYDAEINRGQERLKKVRGKREKAKNQGIKERIKEETEELNSENRELAIQIKTLFQQNQVPLFCRSRFYYALYFTKGLYEAAILLMTFLVCFLAVPYGSYILTGKQNTMYLIGIYIAAVIIFGGAYILINNITKVRHRDSLKRGRSILNVMISNNKKIRVITNTIRKDRNETIYDLEKYDDEIAKIEQELSEITQKKKEALTTFNKITKTIISDEIASSSKARLEELKNNCNTVSLEIKEINTRIKEKNLNLSDEYETYLGKDFMYPEKLGKIKEIINSGEASNITEAVNIYKNTVR